MVEYALLLAGTSFGTISVAVNAFLLRIDWRMVSYVLLALVALRIAFWAFDSRSDSR